jgi:F-type H+-transporting ATPase subunit b
MAHEKIALAESQAMADIRVAAADLATAAAEKLIAARLDRSGATKLVDDSIKDLAGKLN